MKGQGVWWRLWYVWLIPGLLVALNVVWLAGVRGAVLGRGSLLTRQVETTEGEVARLESQQAHLQRTEEQLASLKGDLAALREEQLGRMSARLVPFLTDVVQRAEQSGLRPERIGYTVQRDEKTGLVGFSASYNVKGGYEQIRECVSQLESSPQFIIVERLGLRGQDDASSLTVDVQLTVETFFSDTDEKLLKELGVEVVRGE